MAGISKNIIAAALIILTLATALAFLSFSESPAAGQTDVAGQHQSIRECSSDSDCACGRHKESGECFYGNKEFVAAGECPDFCSGIAGNLAIRCVNNTCKQVALALQECDSDADCAAAGCSMQLCVPRSKVDVITTCEWRSEYDCLRLTQCGCAAGRCAWQKSDAYRQCMENV